MELIHQNLKLSWISANAQLLDSPPEQAQAGCSFEGKPCAAPSDRGQGRTP